MHARRHSRSGFTLLELIVTVAVLAVLASALVPVSVSSFNSRARRDTVQELRVLADASLEFFRDVGRLPASADELLSAPGGATGWAGPYVSGAEVLDGANGMTRDAWSRNYRFDVSGDELTVRSSGRDGAMGTSADLTAVADATVVRREITRDRLDVINLAILHYNAQYQTSDPLPASWSMILTKLESRGFLPSSADFQTDGWGDPFVEDPAGRSPVVRVTSSHL